MRWGETRRTECPDGPMKRLLGKRRSSVLSNVANGSRKWETENWLFFFFGNVELTGDISRTNFSGKCESK